MLDYKMDLSIIKYSLDARRHVIFGDQEIFHVESSNWALLLARVGFRVRLYDGKVGNLEKNELDLYIWMAKLR